MTELAAWDGFYVVVGSAAGALIGLQFVVLTLIAQRPPENAQLAGAAFSTPTIVHFSAALLVSALVQAPWRALTAPEVIFGLAGVCGTVYAILVARWVGRQNAYRPQFEDWLFRAGLPIAAYALLTVAAVAMRAEARPALFGVAAATLVLLFLGIHNAWDNIAYHVLTRSRTGPEAGD
jgi:hypothetical protein